MDTHNIHTLSIFAFYEVLNTQDFSHLLIKKKEVSDSEVSELENAWRILFFEFIDSRGDSKTKYNLKTYLQVLVMQLKYNLIKSSLLLTKNGIDNGYLKTIGLDNTPMARIQKMLNRLENKINLKKVNNKEVFDTESDNEQSKNVNIFHECALMHKILDIKISPLTTTVSEYLGYEKLLKDFTKK